MHSLPLDSITAAAVSEHFSTCKDTIRRRVGILYWKVCWLLDNPDAAFSCGDILEALFRFPIVKVDY